MVISKKTIIFQGFRGGPTFSGGGGGNGVSNFFQGGGGVQMLISIETHIACDFPGGSGPLSPLLIRSCYVLRSSPVLILSTFSVTVFSMYFQSGWKTVLNLIRWCRQKQSDLNLLCFQKG